MPIKKESKNLNGHGKIVAIFDIGTSSVSGALVRLPRKGDEARPVIIHTAKTDISFQENLDFKRFFGIMTSALETTALKLMHSRSVAPEKVYCFLSSPWYASQTRTITFAKSTSFTFTKRLAGELIEKDLKRFENAYLKNYREIGSPVELIENKIMDVRLNGYKTEDPFGKRAKELEMHLFFCIASKALLDGIEYAIHKSVKTAPVSFHSFVFPSFIVARDMVKESKNFLLVDISGEMTDVSIVHNDALLESVSFPQGKNFIVRSLSRALATTNVQAASLLRMHSAKTLSTGEAARIEKAIASSRKQWRRSFEKALFQLSNNVVMPDDVFLSVDGDVAPFFSESIKNEEFTQYMRTAGAFNVILLEYALLRKFSKAEEKIDRDPFLMIESIFINKLAS